MIIERNTTIPTRKVKAFTTVEHNQRRVRIHVLQGEGFLASMNKSLAVFELVGIEPAPAGVPQIDVTFEINADGLVRVSAKDKETGLEQRVEVRPSSGLSPAEVNELRRRQTGRELAKQGANG
jgi:molecular chaperone DnaK